MSICPNPTDDLHLLLTAAAAGADAAVLADLARQGFADLRVRHGYVFQHLLAGPRSIGALAALLGITPQGASKAVLELEALGYVRRAPSSEDQRTHFVCLTERGVAAVEAGRAARAAFAAGAERDLGSREYARLLGALRALAEQTGGWARLTGRRLRAGGD